MSSSDTLSFSLDERQRLREVARKSIYYGLKTGGPLPINLEDYPPSLQQIGANFVTLQRENQLRGCIGTVNAHRPLIKDAAENAYASAFRDPRFPPLRPTEFNELAITLSVLTPPQLVAFQNEEDLLSQLRPGIDGLILEEGVHRSTFLPAVWETLPKPQIFLRELKRKAGLSHEHWSTSLRVWRYRVAKI